MRKHFQHWALAAGCTIPAFLAGAAFGAAPTAEQALGLTPIQKNVDFDRPSAAEIPKCTVTVEARGTASGWIVRGPNGETLRQFFDTNGDNKVDLWCYFKDGIEVYRDVDANFNNKADQYRWLGTAGTRWGLDTNEDGLVDSWKVISAEEVTAEIVAAVRDKDAARFAAVVLTVDEADKLSLGKEDTADLKKKSAEAIAAFNDAIRGQSVVLPKSQWISFGASRPGTIPAGTNGSSADIRVYDNVSAVIEADGKHSQLIVGTLVQVGDTWKAIDLPKNLSADVATVAQGRFFRASDPPSRPTENPMSLGGVSEAVQKLITDMERVDKGLAAARTAAEMTKLNIERANIIEQIIAGVTDVEDRAMWMQQYAETVSAAVQAGQFSGGIARLEKLLATVETSGDQDLIAFVKFRLLTGKYNSEVQQEGADFAKLHTEWLANLEKFITDFSNSDEAAEAKLQLAMGHEFSGDETAAIEWYGKIVAEHPEHPSAKKSAGAKRRLQSLGQPMVLRGNTFDGKTFDLAAYKGRVVLVQYWATWCEPCKQDMQTIAKLQAKYAKAGFVPVGVNLDSSGADAVAFLKANKLPWVNVYEAGGLESRLANEMGILTLPTMLLIDKNGKLVNRSVMAAELDKELEKLLK